MGSLFTNLPFTGGKWVVRLVEGLVGQAAQSQPPWFLVCGIVEDTSAIANSRYSVSGILSSYASKSPCAPSSWKTLLHS